MPTEYLGTAAVAERAGLTVPTIRSYIFKGLMPDADVIITTPSGPLRGWAPETIDAWQASRPGQGARTDLYLFCRSHLFWLALYIAHNV